MRSDSRIEDILHTLADPEEFVRGILGRFIGERFSQDEAVIRIGISGAGIAPHYCIEQGRVVDRIEDGPRFTIGRHQRRAIFHGRTHKPILENEFQGLSWSSAAMTFAEVQALLGRLRASRKAH
jgi:hypothetical protein